MSNWEFEDNGAPNLGNSSEASGPKALRDAYEAMKKQNEELSQKLTSFLEEQQKQKMATVFDSLGVPQAARVYDGPADPEKAKAWVDSMRSIFGGAAPQAAEQPVAPKLPESMQAQFERLSQAGAGAEALGNVEAAQAAVNDANNVQALINSFKNLHS
jgi:cell fate (sporulation/competence/biofilm development) regulator YlbF (YheA/YmcA/DUF963 family)